LPQGRTGYEQDCRQGPEPKKDKKLTKREAGISHKMELAEIRLRFVDTWRAKTKIEKVHVILNRIHYILDISA
jgi:hypothetical protein